MRNAAKKESRRTVSAGTTRLRVKVVDGEVEGKIRRLRRFERKVPEKSRQLRSQADKKRDKKKEVTTGSGSAIYIYVFQRGTESEPMIGRHGSGTIGGV